MFDYKPNEWYTRRRGATQTSEARENLTWNVEISFKVNYVASTWSWSRIELLQLLRYSQFIKIATSISVSMEAMTIQNRILVANRFFFRIEFASGKYYYRFAIFAQKVSIDILLDVYSPGAVSRAMNADRLQLQSERFVCIHFADTISDKLNLSFALLMQFARAKKAKHSRNAFLFIYQRFSGGFGMPFSCAKWTKNSWTVFSDICKCFEKCKVTRANKTGSIIKRHFYYYNRNAKWTHAARVCVKDFKRTRNCETNTNCIMGRVIVEISG